MFENVITTCNNVLGCQLAGNEGTFVFLIIAFLGGVLSSISPCTLGVLPIIIGYVAGYGEKRTFKTFVQLASFTLGLAFVMSIVGIISVLFGRVFVALGGDYWVLIIASLLVVLGLDLLGIIELNFPQLVKKMPKMQGGQLFLYPFTIGIFFALASTPCSTPILVSILGFASLTENILFATALLFLFALGQGVIIILAGVFTSVIVNLKYFAKMSNILMKFAGVLLILSGFYIYYKVFAPYLKSLIF